MIFFTNEMVSPKIAHPRMKNEAYRTSSMMNFIIPSLISPSIK